MKSNAPEKLYIDFRDKAERTWRCAYTEKALANDLEYIRKDAFIEKACEWFKNNWREYVNTDKDGVVCFGHWEKDFEKYMEGE